MPDRIKDATATAVVLCLPWLASCGVGTDAHNEGGVRDSSGVRIVESKAPVWADDAGWRVSAKPTVSIGVVDGPLEYQFDDITGVMTLPDGRIVVVNEGSAELRIYASDGSHLRTVGRRGRGPGEFQDALSGTVSGESLLAFDGTLNRLSVFDFDGQFLTSHGLAPTGDPIRPARMYRLAGIVPDRGYLFLPRSYPADMRPEPTVYRDSVPNLLYGFDGTVLGTVGSFSGVEIYATPHRSGGLRFGRETSADVHDGALYIGHGKRYEIEVYTPGGTLSKLIRRETEAQPAADAIPRLFEWAEQRAAEAGAPPDALAEFRREVEREPHAQTLPFYGDLVIDELGNVWVERYRPRWAEGPHDWDVFAPTGRWLGTVQIREGLEVHEIGRDYVLGVWRDAFDVEHVQRYALARDDE